MTQGYTDTPLLPGGQWTVHDSRRPQPPVITPPQPGSDTQPGTPPSDARVLFDGSSLDDWESARQSGQAAEWKIDGAELEVAPGTGDIQTKAHFGHVHLHVEMMPPRQVKGEGQGRGNSGIFMNGLYEIQVLDSYDNPTYADGACGALYGQKPPQVNPCLGPGHWHCYDILFDPPSFEGDRLVKPAYATVLLNGVLLHHHAQLQGPTAHKTLTCYEPQPHEGPIKLQDHGDLVRFRNIWLRPILGRG